MYKASIVHIRPPARRQHLLCMVGPRVSLPAMLDRKAILTSGRQGHCVAFQGEIFESIRSYNDRYKALLNEPRLMAMVRFLEEWTTFRRTIEWMPSLSASYCICVSHDMHV